ncbi:MAG: hypothetical protein IAE85_03975 [Anaerolinea sp.]|nr:hypothetical protein [Anaerolinea sp.]
MAVDPSTYLAEVELALIVSQIVARYEVVRSWYNTDDGYIRVRIALTNGDFLESTEYFVVDQGHVQIMDYRHQWMDGTRTSLRRRWDCTPHHPEVDGFPHHVHVGSEGNVVTGRVLGVIDLLHLIEKDMSV